VRGVIIRLSRLWLRGGAMHAAGKKGCRCKAHHTGGP
jgi:hypothetical protein